MGGSDGNRMAYRNMTCLNIIADCNTPLCPLLGEAK